MPPLSRELMKKPEAWPLLSTSNRLPKTTKLSPLRIRQNGCRPHLRLPYPGPLLYPFWWTKPNQHSKAQQRTTIQPSGTRTKCNQRREQRKHRIDVLRKPNKWRKKQAEQYQEDSTGHWPWHFSCNTSSHSPCHAHKANSAFPDGSLRANTASFNPINPGNTLSAIPGCEAGAIPRSATPFCPTWDAPSPRATSRHASSALDHEPSSNCRSRCFAEESPRTDDSESNSRN